MKCTVASPAPKRGRSRRLSSESYILTLETPHMYVKKLVIRIALIPRGVWIEVGEGVRPNYSLPWRRHLSAPLSWHKCQLIPVHCNHNITLARTAKHNTINLNERINKKKHLYHIYLYNLIYKGRLVCLSECVIRMDGQTACRILTKIWKWIAIYPRGNIGGGVVTYPSIL